MPDRIIINKTISFVKNQFKIAEPGHDWWHTFRVWKTAKKIGNNYNVNDTLLELGALLHDIADAKFYNGNENIGPSIAFDFMKSLNIDIQLINKVTQIIKNISYKNKDSEQPDFLEFKIIQDADRLDAIGAIGIARAFSYGGYKKNIMYDPEIKPKENMTNEEYKKSESTTINHFYEKLFTLKSLFNTPEALKIAEQRYTFMQQFLKRFIYEWEGKDFNKT